MGWYCKEKLDAIHSRGLKSKPKEYLTLSFGCPVSRKVEVWEMEQFCNKVQV